QRLVRDGACEREILFETGRCQRKFGAPDRKQPFLTLFRLETRVDLDPGAEDIGDRAPVLSLGNSAEGRLDRPGLACPLRRRFARRNKRRCDGESERSNKNTTCPAFNKQLCSP